LRPGWALKPNCCRVRINLRFKNSIFTDVVVLAALDHFQDVERFFHEARRVLRPGGRLHILQSIHDLRGPISALKVVGHKLKDALEERTMRAQQREAPKHLAEFSFDKLKRRAESTFDVARTMRHSASLFAPVKLFMTLEPKPRANAMAGKTLRSLN